MHCHCKWKMKGRRESFQNRIIMFCLQVPSLIYLWEKYIFPGSDCLFCCREICGPILEICTVYRSQTHEWGNWYWGRTIPRKGITKRDFPCSVRMATPSWWHGSHLLPFWANLTCIWETLGILTTLPGLDSGRLRNILTLGGCCWPLLAAVAAEGSGWRPTGPFTCEKMGLKKGGCLGGLHLGGWVGSCRKAILNIKILYRKFKKYIELVDHWIYNKKSLITKLCRTMSLD